MRDVEFGKCDMCGRVAPLQKKDYYFDISCECHDNEHVETIRYCSDCVPLMPVNTTITLYDKKSDKNKTIYIDTETLELILDARTF